MQVQAPNCPELLWSRAMVVSVAEKARLDRVRCESLNFCPGVSKDAATKMRRTMRSWRLHLRSDKAIEDLARMWNPVIRGWIQYYGKFYKSALYPVFQQLIRTLARWASRKFRRLRRHQRRAVHWLGRLARREPQLFAHWQLLGLRPAAG